MTKTKRGNIIWVNLNPTIGDEASKIRPCLILQNDPGNRYSRKTVVAPFLKAKSYPFMVNVTPSAQNGLGSRKRIRFISYSFGFNSANW